MRLLLIREGTWSFYTPCNQHGQCELLVFLENLNAQSQAAIERLMSFIDMASRESQGPNCFDDGISHYVDQNNKIFEFVAGRLRLLWFYSPTERKIIICSHAFLKKTNKTPKSDIRKAIKLKKDYEDAWNKGQIEII